MVFKNKRIILINIIFSVLLALAGTIAHYVSYINNGYTKLNLLVIFVLYFVASFFIVFALFWISGKGYRGEIKKIGKKELISIFFMLFLSYLLCLLTYFPGVGMNDGLNILNFGMSQSGQFPVFYCAFLTALAKIGKHFGSLQISIAIYSVIQIIICSIITSGIIEWTFSKKLPKGIKIFILCYFIFMPIICMYAISMLKDTVFSLLLVVFSILLYELMSGKIENQKRYCIISLITIMGIIMLRNNGKYVVIFCLLLAYIFGKNRKKRKVILFQALIAVISLIMVSTAMHYFHSKQLFQEAAGIPLQQVCATVANDGKITAEQRHFINKLMPVDQIKTKYNPYTADPIKWDPDGKFNRFYLESHKKQFIKVWIDMFPANMKIYIVAYLRQTFQFWAPLPNVENPCFYTIETYYNNAWLPDFTKQYHIRDHSIMLNPLRKIFKGYYRRGYYFNEGLCFWIIIALLLLTYQKDKKIFYMYMPTIALWLTIMISTPISGSFRYVLVYAYIMPIYISMLCLNNQAEGVVKKKEGESE